MVTVNSEDQDDKKDKVVKTEISKETTTEPISEVKESDDGKDDDEDDDGGRDVAPVSGKKGK